MRCAGVVVAGRISSSRTRTPAQASCHAASHPARPPPTHHGGHPPSPSGALPAPSAGTGRVRRPGRSLPGPRPHGPSRPRIAPTRRATPRPLFFSTRTVAPHDGQAWATGLAGSVKLALGVAVAPPERAAAARALLDQLALAARRAGDARGRVGARRAGDQLADALARRVARARPERAEARALEHHRRRRTRGTAGASSATGLPPARAWSCTSGSRSRRGTRRTRPKRSTIGAPQRRARLLGLHPLAPSRRSSRPWPCSRSAVKSPQKPWRARPPVELALGDGVELLLHAARCTSR